MASDRARRPIPASYWVEDAHFLAGEYPGHREPSEARRRLDAFVVSGVTYFLDLTEADEGLEPYADMLSEIAERRGRAVTHRRMAIRDLGVPTIEKLNAILDTLDDALAQGHRVYVHCWGGIGRTGTVVGAWLVRHGMTGAQALERVRELIGETPKAGKVSPETSAQRQMVLRWKEHGRRR